jgi:hypothetical protein
VEFDEQENAAASTATPFPFYTTRAAIGTSLAVGAPFGWLFLNLNDGNLFQEFFRQAYVATIMSAEGRFSVGYDAFGLNSLTLGADNRRGGRNPDPTLGAPPNPSAPTLFGGP